MWSKKTKARPKSGAADTLITVDTKITGDVSFSGVLFVDGYIKGNVIASEENHSLLTVGAQGHIEGEVKVPQVVIYGYINGDVHASESLNLQKDKPTSSISDNSSSFLMESKLGAKNDEIRSFKILPGNEWFYIRLVGNPNGEMDQGYFKVQYTDPYHREVCYTMPHKSGNGSSSVPENRSWFKGETYNGDHQVAGKISNILFDVNYKDMEKAGVFFVIVELYTKYRRPAEYDREPRGTCGSPSPCLGAIRRN